MILTLILTLILPYPHPFSSPDPYPKSNPDPYPNRNPDPKPNPNSIGLVNLFLNSDYRIVKLH